ncbi:hypothetical protein [Furfurilactobacillus cerevisiae]|uniref:hypothetical protein n=1 Tax=Furfurilactobacillus rossiae TaxID=231049 RepID=UPI003B98198D
MTTTQFDKEISRFFRIVQESGVNPERETIALELFMNLITYEFGYLQDAVFTHEVQATSDSTFDSFTMRIQRKDS